MIVGGADGNDVRVIGRCVPCTVRSIVAGCDHHNDAFQPRILDGGVDRTGAVGFLDRRLQREVQHADVEGVFVGDCPQNRVHDGGGGRGTVAIVDTQIDQVGIRRNADVLAGAGIAVASDDARDRRPVAIVVGNAVDG